MSGDLVEKAARIAITAHAGQVRKDDGFPYIVHPFMVAHILTRHRLPDAVVAAGLVHDVLEDTDFPEEQLRAQLGDEVLNIVTVVTYDKSLSWEEKRIKYVEAVRNGPEGAKAVSVADKMANAANLIASYASQGKEVWKNFNRGKEKKMWFEHLVLDMLRETWQHPLVDEYARLVDAMDAMEA